MEKANDAVPMIRTSVMTETSSAEQPQASASLTPPAEMVPEMPLDDYVKSFRYDPPTSTDETTMSGDADVLRAEAAAATPAVAGEEAALAEESSAPAPEDVRERLGLEEPAPEEERIDRPRFLDFIEPPSTPKEPEAPAPTIVGPSFLGLNDAPEASVPPLAETDAPAPSSDRRWTWLAVAALLVVVVLAGLEWRAQGNLTGNVPVEGIKAKLRNAWRSYSPATQTTGTATPPAPVEEQAKTQGQDSAARSSAPNPALNDQSAAADTTPPANAANQKQNTQPASPQKVAESKPSSSTDGAKASLPPNAATEAGTPAKTSAKPAGDKDGSTDIPSQKGAPGAEELAKANNASDSAAAAAWLWKATAKGNPEAPVRLAGMYVKGDGVPRSCEQAMVLLKTAATKPNAQARNRLGAMYDSGTCVERDLVKAYHWLTSALTADPNSDWALQNRERIWREMTPEERGVAKEYQQ